MLTLIRRVSARSIPISALKGEAKTYSVDGLSASVQLDFNLPEGEGRPPRPYQRTVQAGSCEQKFPTHLALRKTKQSQGGRASPEF